MTLSTLSAPLINEGDTASGSPADEDDRYTDWLRNNLPNTSSRAFINTRPSRACRPSIASSTATSIGMKSSTSWAWSSRHLSSSTEASTLSGAFPPCSSLEHTTLDPQPRSQSLKRGGHRRFASSSSRARFPQTQLPDIASSPNPELSNVLPELAPVSDFQKTRIIKLKIDYAPSESVESSMIALLVNSGMHFSEFREKVLERLSLTSVVISETQHRGKIIGNDAEWKVWLGCALSAKGEESQERSAVKPVLYAR